MSRCWGTDDSNHKMNAFSLAMQTPGPGTYEVVDPGFMKKRAPSFTIYPRIAPIKEPFQKPGPGAHQPEKVRRDPIAFPSLHPSSIPSPSTRPVLTIGELVLLCVFCNLFERQLGISSRARDSEWVMQDKKVFCSELPKAAEDGIN